MQMVLAETRLPWIGCLSFSLLSIGLMFSSAVVAQSQPAFPVLPTTIEGYDNSTNPDNPYRYHFPRDYGAHPQNRSELWTLDALLTTQSGGVAGLQSRFLRTAIKTPPKHGTTAPSDSRWRFHEVFTSLHALTDPQAEKISYAEFVSRGALDLAGNDTKSVWVNSSSLELDGAGECEISVVVQGWLADAPMDLSFHEGECVQLLAPDAGLSVQGYGQALVRASGFIGEVQVTDGQAWLQRAWGDLPVDSGPVVTDQLKLALPGNRYLSLLRTRRRDGTGTPVLSGTLLDDSGQSQLDYRQLRLEDISYWTSGTSGRNYANSWQLTLPASVVSGSENPDVNETVTVNISAVLDDQEIQLLGRYSWSGLVVAQWKVKGTTQSVHGFAEMSGQDSNADSGS